MPRAIVVERTGGPEVLRVAERDPGAPGAGQARVRVAGLAAGARVASAQRSSAEVVVAL